MISFMKRPPRTHANPCADSEAYRRPFVLKMSKRWRYFTTNL